MPERFGPELTRKDMLRASLAGGVLLTAGGLAACGGDDSSGTTTGGSSQAATPRRGGTFRYGVAGSGTDTLDAHIGSGSNEAVVAYAINLNATLMRPDHRFVSQPWLAEEVSPNADASEWTIRLREGAQFSDGRPITADDIIFSFRRVLDPRNGSAAALIIASVDPKGMRKLDERTVRLTLKSPDVGLADGLAKYSTAVVPQDYNPKRPISAGPFKIEEFVPGQRAIFSRNENYFEEGRPYLDSLEIITFGDPTARINALLSGEIDGLGRLGAAQVPLAEGDANLQTLQSETGGFVQITLRTDRGLLKDPRVRQAFKHIVDREQMVQQVYGGRGRVANDIPGITDPLLYPTDIPQREHDPERARSLLKAAGAEGLTIPFYTRPEAPGMVESAQVFAQQAKDAGVNVKVEQIPDVTQFYTKYYGQVDLAQDYYYSGVMWIYVDYGMLPSAPYNTVNWDNPEATRLLTEARGTLDEPRRRELVGEAMKIFWDDGGWLIWGFETTTDAYSRRFTGAVEDASDAGLNGVQFDQIGLA